MVTILHVPVMVRVGHPRGSGYEGPSLGLRALAAMVR